MGKQWKQWLTVFFLASKITVDGDCNHEIKRRFLLERKVMTKLDSILEKEKIQSATVSTVSPSICRKVKGLDSSILVF